MTAQPLPTWRYLVSAAFVGVLVAMLATFSSGFVYVTLIERMDANNAALAALFAAVAFAPVYGLAPAAIGIVAGIALRQGAGAKSVWLVGALSAAAGAGTAWLLDGMWIADALNLPIAWAAAVWCLFAAGLQATLVSRRAAA